MEKYGEYKCFRNPWIKHIPSCWDMRKIRYCFREQSRKGFPDEPSLCATQSHGVIPQSLYDNRVVVVNKNFDQLKLVKVGDFVISLRSFEGGIEYAYYRGIISAAYTILEPKNADYSAFYKYLFKSHSFVQLLKTCVTGIREGQNINYPLLNKQFIPLPPLSEQSSIVSYLDVATAKMDKFVTKKEQEIELLEKLKQRIIADAVTKGLDPNAEMVPCDIPWIKQIPKGWKVTTLRELLKLVTEKNHPEATLLSVTREQGVIVRNKESKEENHNFIPEDLSNYKYVRKGQFAINKMKSWQGSYGVSDHDGIVSPAYYVCDLKFNNKEFFSMAIRSKAYLNFFIQYSKGIRVDQWDLSTIALKNIPFLIPSKDEQQSIVEYITVKCEKIDKLKSGLQQEIEKVKQYKQRLISDVVTGQIKVC